METVTSGTRYLLTGFAEGHHEQPQDLAAWDDFVRHYTKAVQQQTRRFTGNLSDAEGLAQDALSRALRALPLRRVANVDAWLNRITLNLLIDQVRRRQRLCFLLLPRQVLALGDTPVLLVPSVPASRSRRK